MAHVKWTICLLAIGFSAAGCARDRVATDDGPSAALGGDSARLRLSDQKDAEPRPRKRGGYEFVEPPPVPPALGVSFGSRTSNWLKTAVGRPLDITGNNYQELPEGQDDVEYPSPTPDSEFDQSATHGSGVRYAPPQTNPGCGDSGCCATGCGESGCGESGCPTRPSSLFDAICSRKRPSILKKLFSFGRRHDPCGQGCADEGYCTTPYRGRGCGSETGYATSGGQAGGSVDSRPVTPSLDAEPRREEVVEQSSTVSNPPNVAPEGDWAAILDDLNSMRSETTEALADEPATDDEVNPFTDRPYEENPFADMTFDESLPANDDLPPLDTPEFGPLEAMTPDAPTQELPIDHQFDEPAIPYPSMTPPLRHQPRRAPLSEPPIYDGAPGGEQSPEGYIEPPVWNRRTRATQKPYPPRRDSVRSSQSAASSVMKTASHSRRGENPTTQSTASQRPALLNAAPLKITPGNQVDYLP